MAYALLLTLSKSFGGLIAFLMFDRDVHPLNAVSFVLFPVISVYTLNRDGTD